MHLNPGSPPVTSHPDSNPFNHPVRPSGTPSPPCWMLIPSRCQCEMAWRTPYPSWSAVHGNVYVLLCPCTMMAQVAPRTTGSWLPVVGRPGCMLPFSSGGPGVTAAARHSCCLEGDEGCVCVRAELDEQGRAQRVGACLALQYGVPAVEALGYGPAAHLAALAAGMDLPPHLAAVAALLPAGEEQPLTWDTGLIRFVRPGSLSSGPGGCGAWHGGASRYCVPHLLSGVAPLLAVALGDGPSGT
jgi:hypothetical protein